MTYLEMEDANFWIERLNLVKHPEGGYFKEVYRSDEIIQRNALPDRYRGDRPFGTSIYFLLRENDVSRFHRIKSDETWHFYRGTTLELFVLEPRGVLIRHLLGPNPDAGEHLQMTIPHSHWFAARVAGQTGFSLLGCTVAPGFDYGDFELANKEKLIAGYPRYKKLVRSLTSTE